MGSWAVGQCGSAAWELSPEPRTGECPPVRREERAGSCPWELMHLSQAGVALREGMQRQMEAQVGAVQEGRLHKDAYVSPGDNAKQECFNSANLPPTQQPPIPPTLHLP